MENKPIYLACSGYTLLHENSENVLSAIVTMAKDYFHSTNRTMETEPVLRDINLLRKSPTLISSEPIRTSSKGKTEYWNAFLYPSWDWLCEFGPVNVGGITYDTHSICDSFWGTIADQVICDGATEDQLRSKGKKWAVYFASKLLALRHWKLAPTNIPSIRQISQNIFSGTADEVVEFSLFDQQPEFEKWIKSCDEEFERYGFDVLKHLGIKPKHWLRAKV